MKLIDHPTFIGTLPITADVSQVKKLLKGTGLRLWRRGRGPRSQFNTLTPPSKWFPNGRVCNPYSGHLPLKNATKQSLYLRGEGYSGKLEANTQLVTLLRNIVREMPNSTVNV